MSEDGALTEAARRFDPEVIDLLAQEQEVELETWSQSGEVHRATIWVIVNDGVPYIRTYTGPRARWYRELRLESHGAVYAGGRTIPIRAVPASDAASIEAYSAEVQRKYAGDPATPAMVRDEVLDTTLRLEPD